MALIADSGGLYALYDRSDKNHQAVKAAVGEETGPIILPAAILAEVDYLLRTKLGPAAEVRLLEASWVVRLASSHSLRLTPRASATSC